ncbi:MAG TPA: precorrin-3B C(17)-methyltransferase [Acidimicrobiales bacterium]|nr:precorrin-3B C(17)-methyltransferase [Acidimicrobiales bacterium]
MRILCLSVTDAGAAVAARLPYEHRRGRLVAGVAEEWDHTDAFVLVAATGIAVRAIAPHLGDKRHDPAVVCVDDGGRWVVALTGGHHGANDLAVEVAALLGATAVVTTATEAAGLPALEGLAGLRADGDVAGVTRAWLDGNPPELSVDPELSGWPLPAALGRLGPATGQGRLRLTDRVGPAGPGEVLLRPPSLVLGIGTSSGADPAATSALVDSALAEAGLDPHSVAAVASIDRKANEPAVVSVAARFGVRLRLFPAGALASVAVPNPSEVVAAAVGTPSVAEAAAVLAAGPGATLVLPKRRNREATVALARRAGPEGHLAVVGVGPGDARWRTPEATSAVRSAQVVIGYGPYVDLVGDLLSPAQEVLRLPIGAEVERCRRALELAAGGRQVALVCSGDPGVFAMASLACELAPHHGDPALTVVPGVTAALAAAAVLGAPLGHDHAAISLSDLLTPWAVIEARVEAVASADMAVSFYNPRSARRSAQLGRALELLARCRPPDTPAAVVTNVGRPGQRVVRTTLAELDPDQVDMLSLVVVGSSSTRWIGERMVTPRGYSAGPGGAAATGAGR